MLYLCSYSLKLLTNMQVPYQAPGCRLNDPKPQNQIMTGPEFVIRGQTVRQSPQKHPKFSLHDHSIDFRS